MTERVAAGREPTDRPREMAEANEDLWKSPRVGRTQNAPRGNMAGKRSYPSW